MKEEALVLERAFFERFWVGFANLAA